MKFQSFRTITAESKLSKTRKIGNLVQFSSLVAYLNNILRHTSIVYYILVLYIYIVGLTVKLLSKLS